MTGSAAEYALDLCARIAAHTDVPGTITRTFLSPSTHAVHALLRAEMEALGMVVRIDSIGNVRGLYPAATPGAPRLLIGSHIDTVPDAGAFDGVLGVAFALVLVRELGGERLPYAIEVIAFSEEEGIRFKLPFLGSRALVGDLDAQTLAGTDDNGVSIAEAIRNFGLNPEALADAALAPDTFAYFEFHIEQGPLLESHGVPLGIVEVIAGQTRLEYTFEGQANHAGTTPMEFRKDALAAAAHWMRSVERYPHVLGDPHLRTTVGSIRAFPGAANIIPGKAVLSLDVRHPDDAVRHHAVRKLFRKATRIAATRGVTVTAVETSSQPATPMDPTLTAMLAEAALAQDIPVHRMVSGAGHDAMILARKVPTAMLFVRTPGGISHHPAESVAIEDVDAAIRTCLHLLKHLQPDRLQRPESIHR